jgi:uncharacterized membrane protein
MTCRRRKPRSGRLDLTAEDGSTIPLVLGFFLIGLLVVAGAVLAGDAYTEQRDLQSICDGAALAAANAIDSRAARTQELNDALPLVGVQQAVGSYLARDPGRASTSIRATVALDGRTVTADCHRHTQLAFGTVIGKADGIDQHATAHARSILG